jgi:hypothetical protein
MTVENFWLEGFQAVFLYFGLWKKCELVFIADLGQCDRPKLILRRAAMTGTVFAFDDAAGAQFAQGALG